MISKNGTPQGMRWIINNIPFIIYIDRKGILFEKFTNYEYTLYRSLLHNWQTFLIQSGNSYI